MRQSREKVDVGDPPGPEGGEHRRIDINPDAGPE
jgi:hypothetical protein